MKIAILVPTVPKNESALKECLNSIIENSKDYDYEILVWKNDFEGYVPSMNAILKQALSNPKITHFLFMNDDIYIRRPDWLDFFKAEFDKNTNAGIVAPSNLLGNSHIRMGFAMMSREVIEKVGIFDERFKMLNWDDVDMSVRVLEAGYQLCTFEHKRNEALNLNGELYVHDNSRSKKHFNKQMIEEMEYNKQRFKEKWKNSKWGSMWN